MSYHKKHLSGKNEKRTFLNANSIIIMNKTEKKTTVHDLGISGLLSLLLAITFMGCSSEPDEGFEFQYEILGELFGDLQQATREIEFGSAPEDAHHLLRGWSGIEEKLRWANANTAELSFYHTGLKLTSINLP
jgi:hypothetical protein